MPLQIALFLSLFFTINSIEISVIKMPEAFIPGTPNVVLFAISNNSDKSCTPKVNLKLPKGWTIITQPFVGKIEAGQTKRVLFTISVPNSAASGAEQLLVQVVESEVISAQKQVEIYVKEIHTIDLKVIKKPSYLREGKDFTCEYLLSNKGNVDEEVQLISRKGIILGKTNLFIKRDSSLVVKVNQKIPLLDQPQILVNDVSVFISKADTTYSKNVPITVYPNQSKKQNIHQKYPIEASFMYNSIQNTIEKLNVFQYDIRGKGFIDRAEKHALEIIVKGTDKAHIDRFETINKHLLIYKHKATIVHLGDFTIGVSRLLENVRFGRGIIYNQQFGKFNSTTFYNKLLFFPEIKDQIGSTISFQPNRKYTFKLNNLKRNYLDKNNDSFASSFVANFTNNNLLIKSEYAISTQNNKNGFGTFANLLYKKPKLHVTGDFVYTSADFEGYYNNSLFVFGGVNVQLNSNFSWSSNIYYSYINPKADLVIAQPFPFFQNYSTSLRFSKNKNQNHKVTLGYRNNQDRSDLQKFNYKENSLRYGYEYKQSTFNMQFASALAATENTLATARTKKGISFQSTLTANFSPFKLFKFGASLDYSKTNRYTNKSLEYFFYGAHLNYSTSEKVQLNFSYRNNLPLEELYKTNSFFNLDLKYKINAKHSLDFSSRYSSPAGSSEKNLFVSMKFNIALDIPLYKNKNLGNLYGKIDAFDAKDKEGVIVNLNNLSTISDENGIFKFNDLLPKEYYLTLDQSSYDSNLISDKPLPLKKVIEAKKTDTISVVLIKPSKIKGTVLYKKSDQLQSNEFSNNLPNLLLKLEKGTDVFYTIINEKGEYSFSEIRPGDWTVSIIKKGLEQKFVFQNSIRQFHLVSGEELTVDFIVEDKVRKTNFSSKKLNIKVTK